MPIERRSNATTPLEKMYSVQELCNDSLHFTHRNNATLSDVGGSGKIRQIR